MFNTVLPIYKGFEIQALVYPNRRADGSAPRHSEGYDVAVKLIRAGAEPTEANSRVFKLSQINLFSAFGEAKRAAEAHGRGIIDGQVPNETIADL
ncbi:hypothetical protein [Pandoraea sp.]|uniref:hypothetical protein n=1 Tax=Pandoraea sp. TaxID=1883445 RepID=UPI001229F4A8|nr:hypothetical protein [Pandoraea sp.]TAL55560.1 MAG: hypothetical protein EPN80_06890 [Pandoraea sp.]TAM20111.1 MAG: hypothetical protein EPN65_01770 [Pandoraea sp.]